MKPKILSILIGIFLIASIILISSEIIVLAPIASPLCIHGNSATINFSMNSNNLSSVIYNWNGTNFTLYNNSLVLMYNFENLSALGENSTYIVDVSKYGNNGTAVGADYNSSGKYGGAYQFDGTDDYINISSQTVNITGPITISFWAYPRSDSVNAVVVGKIYYTGVSDNGGYAVRQYDTRWEVNIANNNWGYLYNDTCLQVDTWQYVVGVYDGTTIKLYVNGISQTGSYSAPGSSIRGATQPLGIGYVESAGGALTSHWDGIIDNVMIWNRSLSSSEIYQQYISNLQKYNQTQWYLIINQSRNSTAQLDNGTYTYQLFETDNSGFNSTAQRTIITGYNTYPSFSDYKDNSGTLEVSGTGVFNVTIMNTNGTVWLSINNTNYTATNITSDTYNVSVNLTTAGTYNYTWYAYGNETSGLVNSSELKYYIVNEEEEESDSEEESSITTYLIEQSSNTDSIKVRFILSPNKNSTLKVKNDKGTGIKEIILKSKKWVMGTIFISAYNETPDFCSIKYSGDYKIYKVLDFNGTIKEDSIDSGIIKLGITKSWISSNNISEIKFVRCYPEYQEISGSYDSEISSEKIYDMYINSFSAYAILGTVESSETTGVNNEEVQTEEKSSSWFRLAAILFWVLIILFIVFLARLIIKHRIKVKRKINNISSDLKFKSKIRKEKMANKPRKYKYNYS